MLAMTAAAYRAIQNGKDQSQAKSTQSQGKPHPADQQIANSHGKACVQSYRGNEAPYVDQEGRLAMQDLRNQRAQDYFGERH
jgi:hypothetical protein